MTGDAVIEDEFKATEKAGALSVSSRGCVANCA